MKPDTSVPLLDASPVLRSVLSSWALQEASRRPSTEIVLKQSKISVEVALSFQNDVRSTQ